MSVQTNVIGISNVVDATIENESKLVDLEAVTMISTDKACAPTNVYGMCKALAERCQCQQATYVYSIHWRALWRVLQSRGSIIPLFQWQAQNLDALQLLMNMTRYV